MRRFYDRLPLTDRITFHFDAQAALLVAVFNGAIMPLLPIIARNLGMDASQLAILGAVPFFGYFFSMFVGYLTETRPKMPFVVLAGMVSRGLFLLFFMVKTPGPFMIIVCAFWLIGSISSPAYSTIMRLNYSDRFRSELMGNIRILLGLASAVIAFFSGRFLDHFPGGYRIVFPLAAVFGMAAALRFGRLKVRESRRMLLVKRNPNFTFIKALRTVGSDHRFMGFLGILMMIGGPSKILIPVEPIRLVDQLGIDYASAGFLRGTLVLISSLIGFGLWGRLGRRGNPFMLLAVGAGLGAARAAFLAAAINLNYLIPVALCEGLSNSAWEILTIQCIIRLTGSGITGGQKAFSLYWGLHMSFIGIRGIIGPIIGSALYTSGTATIVSMYWASSILTFIGAAGVVVYALVLGRLSMK